MNRFSKKMRVAVGVIALTMVAAGAYAYWTGGGSGSGTGTVGTSATVTITGTVGDDLAPGTNVPVEFTAANADTSPITVTNVGLVATGGITVDSGHAGCLVSDFSMVDVTQSHEVPAGATAEALPNDGTLVMANSLLNQNICKGATLTLTLETPSLP
jgi:hypothetical protein